MTARNTSHVVVLAGDGIGPEVTAAAVQVLMAVAQRHGLSLTIEHALSGGAAIDSTGDPLPPATEAAVLRADAVWLGAVGGPKWGTGPVRPEQGLLRLRQRLGTFANVRPVTVRASLASLSPLRPERLRGTDILFVREFTGGLYFGVKTRKLARDNAGQRATVLCVYHEAEIVRVVRLAGAFARARTERLTSVDKANVLETSRLWREVTSRIMADEFPDAAAVLAGSIGLLPSASLSTPRADGTARGLYEPIHGSAPDIAGQGLANPVGAILSVALMRRHSFGLDGLTRTVEGAVYAALDDGVRTADLVAPGAIGATTQAVTEAVLARLA